MKTIKERAEWLFATRRDAEVTATEWVAVMGEVLKEIANAPEPEPVADGHVYVHVSGLTGSGKSAVAGEIEIAMRAIGLDVEWVGSESEKRLTHADYTSALELYRPKVRIFEKNISRTAPPAPSVPELEEYDAGALNDFGGGNVGWWQDYIRSELGRAYEFYCGQLSAAPTPTEAPAQDFEDALEHAFWDFDARHKGYKKTIRPISERDAFKQVLRNFMHEHGGAEAPADVVRDAERYRYLVEKSHYADAPLYLVDKAPDKWVFGERIGAILDAAIEREKKGGAA